ncbi:MAG: glycosyltransferase family 4 protein, partial [Candidatus Parcubacteria bacterium]|nr:glycosyltransferase family 4 protein [Candidatus Parcubacteria bacterium]
LECSYLMRILIFNWRDLKHSWSGGGEIYIFEQAKRWVKMGHEVTVFCGEDIEKKLLPFEIIDGIKIHRKGGRYGLYLWAVWYYLTKLRKNTDVVIDVENGIPFLTPLFCRTPKICYVYHVHGTQFFYELPFPLNYIGYLIEKFIFPLIYSNIPVQAISQTTKRQLMEIGFRDKNITIIYSGMNGLQAKTISKKFSNPTILYLGRIKKYKRVDLLVKIFPKILEKIPNAHLIIAGWGTEASSITDLVMKSSWRRKIDLLGPVSNEEKKTFLSRSWIFVNPSIGEGWSIAVIEANLYGTPAVAFNVPGLSESIQNEKTGLLAQNENDFIEKICKVLTDSNLREKLSKNAIELANSFNWDKSSQESLKILEKIRRKS